MSSDMVSIYNPIRDRINKWDVNSASGTHKAFSVRIPKILNEFGLGKRSALVRGVINNFLDELDKTFKEPTGLFLRRSDLVRYALIDAKIRETEEGK